MSRSLGLNCHVIQVFPGFVLARREVHVWMCLFEGKMKKQIPCGARITTTMPKNILSLTVITVTLTGNYEFAFMTLHRISQLPTFPASCSNISDAVHHRLGRAARLPSSFCADVGTGQSSPNRPHRKVQYLNFSLLLHCSVDWLRACLTTRQKKHRGETEYHANPPHTAVGNKGWKISKTALWQILSKYWLSLITPVLPNLLKFLSVIEFSELCFLAKCLCYKSSLSVFNPKKHCVTFTYYKCYFYVIKSKARNCFQAPMYQVIKSLWSLKKICKYMDYRSDKAYVTIFPMNKTFLSLSRKFSVLRSKF